MVPSLSESDAVKLIKFPSSVVVIAPTGVSITADGAVLGTEELSKAPISGLRPSKLTTVIPSPTSNPFEFDTVIWLWALMAITVVDVPLSLS